MQSFCRALVELGAKLSQSFRRAFAELGVLKFVTWILPQLTARTFFYPIRSQLGRV